LSPLSSGAVESAGGGDFLTEGRGKDGADMGPFSGIRQKFSRPHVNDRWLVGEGFYQFVNFYQ
jgi:hypothetical protein